MYSFTDFLHSNSTIAFLTASLIFFITIFLVAKRWIGFGITFLFLLFAIGTGIAISSYHSVQVYLTHNQNQPTVNLNETEVATTSIQQLTQSIEELKAEVLTEKEILRRALVQIQEIVDHLDLHNPKFHHSNNAIHENSLDNSSDTQKQFE